MKKQFNQEIQIPQDGEVKDEVKYFPPYEENVVTEILYPQSGDLVVRQIIFPNSVGKDPKVIVATKDKTIIPNIHSINSKKVLINTIISGDKEERIESDILITETGKSICRTYNHENGEYDISALSKEIGTKVIVKTDLLLVSNDMIETKRVCFRSEND